MHRSACPGSLWLVAIACGCGPEAREVADVADVCGVDEPVQVIALEDNEVVAAAYGASTRVGDRYLYGVQEFTAPMVDIAEATASPSQRFAVQVGARIEAIGRCGENRRVVAEGIDRITARIDEDAPWIGYRSDTLELFWFDPDGAWPTKRLARSHNAGWHVAIGRSVFVHREDERDFVRISLIGDGEDTVTEVLVDDVVYTSYMNPALAADPLVSLFVLRENGDLVAVDLAEQTVENVQAGVGKFASDSDTRWVAWTPGDPGDPTEPTEAWLLDRETGEQHELTLDGEPEIFVRVFDDIVSVEGRRDGVATATRMIHLPSLDSVLLDGLWWWFGGADGRFGAVDTSEVAENVSVFGHDGGKLVALSSSLPGNLSTQGAVWHNDFSAYDGDFPDEERPHDLVAIPFSTLLPETRERRVWSDVALPADNWAIVRAEDLTTEGVGEFFVIDGPTGRAQLVDDDVIPWLTTFEPHEATTPASWHTDELVYQVRDPGSDRTGLWRVRFD